MEARTSPPLSPNCFSNRSWQHPGNNGHLHGVAIRSWKKLHMIPLTSLVPSTRLAVKTLMVLEEFTYFNRYPREWLWNGTHQQCLSFSASINWDESDKQADISANGSSNSDHTSCHQPTTIGQPQNRQHSFLVLNTIHHSPELEDVQHESVDQA